MTPADLSYAGRPVDHATVEQYFVPTQLALAMFGMGATLSVRDFLQVLRDPRGLALGLGLQLVFVPALAYAFIEIFDLAPGWAVGLCLVAVVPGGAFSNLLTFLGKGNVPLSISVTVASTAGCIATIPLLLGVLASSHVPPDFSFPTQRIVVEIFAYLLVPLALGMVMFRVAEKPSARLSKWAIRGSILLIALITVSALRSGRIRVAEYGIVPPATLLLFGVLLANVTPQVARLFRRYDDDAVALSVEVAVRNIGIALLLVQFFFPGEPEHGHVLYSCLFYAGLSGFLALPIVLRHRLRGKAVLLRAPNPRPLDAPS